MEDVGILYGHLVFSMTVWYGLLPFGVFMVIWCIFPVWVFQQEKFGNPDDDFGLIISRVQIFYQFVAAVVRKRDSFFTLFVLLEKEKKVDWIG
jgi:ABC-type uncharacterized transport system permease subunit